MLNIDPGGGSERSRLNRIRIERVHNLASGIFGAPDSLNRRMALVAYAITDDYVNRFIEGRPAPMAPVKGAIRATGLGYTGGIDKVDVFDGLKINAMAKGQQALYSKLFEDARNTPKDSPEWEAFKEEITRDKIVNINYDYRIQGGPLFKQSPADRTIAGVVTYNMGRWDELYRNGLEPIWRAADDGGLNPANWKTGQWKGALQGVQTVMKMMVNAAVTSAVYGLIFGEAKDYLRGKDEETGKQPTRPTYSLRHSLMFSPERPGYSFAVDAFSTTVEVMGLLAYGDADDMKAKYKFFEKKGIQYSVVLEWAKRAFEAGGNYNGVSNATALQQHFEGMNEDAQRTAWENYFQRFLIGTAEDHDDRRDLPLAEEIWERLKDGETTITPAIRKILESEPAQPRQL